VTLRPGSLQGRLLAMVLGVVTAVWLITAVRTWVDVRHELGELLDGHLAQAAALLVVQQTREIEGRELHGLDTLDALDDTGDDKRRAMDAPLLHPYAPAAAFQVFHEGKLMLRSANAPAVAMVTPNQRAAVGDGTDGDAAPSGFATVQVEGVSWRVYTALGAERDIRVYVGERMESRSAILWAVLRNALGPMALGLPLLALAVWWAVYRGVAPLRRLGQVLAERQPQSLHPVQVQGAPAEMAPMLAELNHLFARIAELMESERRFTADAAHELRTPIAAIRAQAQVALGEPDAGLRRHALQATLEGCDRATRLVEQLLTLSRLEAGAAPKLGPIDMTALVRSVLADQAIAALHKQQSLGLDVPEVPQAAQTGEGSERGEGSDRRALPDRSGAACIVQGDLTLLAVLVRNLVDNAIRYCPRDATIQVVVQHTGPTVSLSVQDSGPGLCDADLARIGERFFRVLGSGEGGSGLGWSIVRRIAAVHGAEVTVARSAVLGGLAVEVRWPSA
jgi:two-component system sensor histidine kinase QseC